MLDHKQEIKTQLLAEANDKLALLQAKLAKIESKRIKDVATTLEANDIKVKIVKAMRLIKKLSIDADLDGAKS